MNQKGGEKKSKHTRLLVKSILISISPYRSLLIDIYRIEKKKWDDWNRGIPFETRSWFLNEEQPRVEKSRAQKVAFQRDQSNFPSFPAAWRSVKKPVGRFKSRLDAFYIVKGPRLYLQLRCQTTCPQGTEANILPFQSLSQTTYYRGTFGHVPGWKNCRFKVFLIDAWWPYCLLIFRFLGSGNGWMSFGRLKIDGFVEIEKRFILWYYIIESLWTYIIKQEKCLIIILWI